MNPAHRPLLALVCILLALACAAAPSGAEAAGEAAGDGVDRARALAAAGEVRPAVEVLSGALAAGGVATADLLAAAEFEPLRGDRAFRELVCERAAGARLHLAPAGEPGVPLRLAGRVVDAEGRALAGARVYAFQTDARGYYSRPRDGRGGDDNRNPRLFACGVSGADGALELVSVLPGSYPGSSIPRHVHYRVEADGHRELVGEILFADDENVGARTRATAERRGWPIVDAPAGEDGVRRGEFVLRLEG